MPEWARETLRWAEMLSPAFFFVSIVAPLDFLARRRRWALWGFCLIAVQCVADFLGNWLLAGGTGLAITEWNYGGGQSISGAIATADRARVVRHLASCRRCREEVAGLAALPALLRQIRTSEGRHPPGPPHAARPAAFPLASQSASRLLTAQVSTPVTHSGRPRLMAAP